MEVGARRYAIYINGVNNIVIQNIDAFGPAGTSSNGCCSSYVPVLIENADNITFRDLEIHGGNGIGIAANKNTTTNIYYAGLHAYDNGGTALYLSSVGGHVINSHVHDNARLSKDIGDRGGIGSNGGNLLIDGNDVYRNGQDASSSDFEISIVGGVEPVTISNNYVHDCLQGCIQIAEGNNNSVIENNTIVGFATSTGAWTSAGKFAGIRVGGGNSGSRNVKVRNNFIAGGALTPTFSYAAIFISGHDNSGIEITGNTFYNNAGTDVSVAANAGVGNAIVSNNSYQNVDFSENWDWKGVLIPSLAEWQTRSGGWDTIGSEEVFISP
jgi:hypothetical protein